MAFTSTQYEQSARFLRERIGCQPVLGLVLGSGLGALADDLTDAVRIPYEEIPGFPRSTVASHAGQLAVGKLSGKPVAMLCGRFHFYEGYDMATAAYYVRVLKLLGVRGLLLTNAAGGVNLTYRPGDFMLIADHIKLCAESPVRGVHDPVWGERFFDMSRVYDPALRRMAQEAAEQMALPLHEGVYFYMAGPQFETPAEIRAIRTLGGDAVGMSTVPEVIVAAQCGLPVLGLSCITNMAAGMVANRVVSDEEVTETAGAVSARFRELCRRVVDKWEV